MTISPDRSLDRYDIIDRIAVGGMAEVFRAKAYGAHGFEKTLAIKRILPELAQDAEFEERFIVEAKLAVQLAHANIVQVFDFGRFGESLFIAMEYVDGLDLAALLRGYRERAQQTSIGAGLHIAIEICKGLDFAHQRGVVHRDVSPSNVLLSRAGEVKLADFGIAQIEREHTESHRGARRIMGKWRYMSPEQTRGDTLAPTSDLFSAAIVMYQLFTGEKLFPGNEAPEILDNIRDMPIPRPSKIRPELPDGLDDLLLKALERDPQRRWQLASEMQRALTEISYQSNIVASAFNVAESVTGLLGDSVAVPVQADVARSGKRALDELIKAQLAGAAHREPTHDTARRTVASGRVVLGHTPVDVRGKTEEVGLLAGTGAATIVRKGVDEDGVTMWDLAATVAAAPSAMRSQRESSASHTQATGTGRGISEAVAPRPLLAIVAIAALLAVAVGAGAVLLGSEKLAGVTLDAGGGSATDDAVAATPDPSLTIDAAAVGVLRVTSDPAGALIRVDGADHPFPAPADIPATAGVVHVVELRMPGFRVWRDSSVQVGTNEVLRVPGRLEPSPAILAVETVPAGAKVYVDGRLMGVTPLRRDDLRGGKRVKLMLVLPDYERQVVTVELVAGETVSVERELVSIPMGTIQLLYQSTSGAVDVYFKDERVAKDVTLQTGKVRLALPVGTQPLRIVSKGGREKTVYVEVRQRETLLHRVTLE